MSAPVFLEESSVRKSLFAQFENEFKNTATKNGRVYTQQAPSSIDSQIQALRASLVERPNTRGANASDPFRGNNASVAVSYRKKI